MTDVYLSKCLKKDKKKISIFFSIKNNFKSIKIILFVKQIFLNNFTFQILTIFL